MHPKNKVRPHRRNRRRATQANRPLQPADPADPDEQDDPTALSEEIPMSPRVCEWDTSLVGPPATAAPKKKRYILRKFDTL
jgi:hypothetical protein